MVCNHQRKTRECTLGPTLRHIDRPLSTVPLACWKFKIGFLLCYLLLIRPIYSPWCAVDNAIDCHFIFWIYFSFSLLSSPIQFDLLWPSSLTWKQDKFPKRCWWKGGGGWEKGKRSGPRCGHEFKIFFVLDGNNWRKLRYVVVANELKTVVEGLMRRMW